MTEKLQTRLQQLTPAPVPSASAKLEPDQAAVRLAILTARLHALTPAIEWPKIQLTRADTFTDVLARVFRHVFAHSRADVWDRVAQYAALLLQINSVQSRAPTVIDYDEFIY